MVECKAATQDEVGLTPLMRAASSGEQATAEELLLRDGMRKNASHTAGFQYRPMKLINVLKFFRRT